MYEFTHTQIYLPQKEEYSSTAILYSSCINLLVSANAYASQQLILENIICYFFSNIIM